MKSRFRLFAGGDPDDAVGEGPLHHFVLGEGLGQHRLADAAHAGQRGEGDGLAVVFGKQRVAQRVQGFRPLQVVGYARRSGEVGDASFAVVVGQGRGGVAADVGEEFAETRGVVGVVGEVAILPGIEVQRPVGALDRQHGNDALALVESEKLFRTADFRRVGTRTQQRDHDLPRA